MIIIIIMLPTVTFQVSEEKKILCLWEFRLYILSLSLLPKESGPHHLQEACSCSSF